MKAMTKRSRGVIHIRPGAHDAIESLALWDLGYGFQHRQLQQVFRKEGTSWQSR